MNIKENISLLEGEELVTIRAHSIVNYIGILLSLANEVGMTHDDLVDWVQGKYGEKGYYEQWSNLSNELKVENFVKLFIRGRNLLYDKISFKEEEDMYIVITETWYEKQLPESFFFFDIDPSDFGSYAANLAIQNAKKIGIKMTIEKEEGLEKAYIFK